MNNLRWNIQKSQILTESERTDKRDTELPHAQCTPPNPPLPPPPPLLLEGQETSLFFYTNQGRVCERDLSKILTVVHGVDRWTFGVFESLEIQKCFQFQFF